MVSLRALELYCGVGGTTKGLQRAGWHVTGVDNQEQEDYCGDEFVLGDAIEFGMKYGGDYDLVVGGPPCQFDGMLTVGTNAVFEFEYPDLLEPTRDVMRKSGRPYVIEQPPGRATKRMRIDLTLCGVAFGLRVFRHRNFEIEGFKVERPSHEKHVGRVAGWRHGIYYEGEYVSVYGDGGGKGSIEEWREAMGIDWTWNRKSLAEAIPPAYGEWIGKKAYDQIAER